MIEEFAQVIKIESQIVWVRAIAKSACGSCQAQKGCGHSLLARAGQKQIDLPVSNTTLDVNVGDYVVIGVPEQAVLFSSLFMYGVPLISMIAAALICESFNATEGLSAALSLFAMLLGFIWVSIKSKKLDASKWQPRLMRKADSVQNHIPMCDITNT